MRINLHDLSSSSCISESVPQVGTCFNLTNGLGERLTIFWLVACARLQYTTESSRVETFVVLFTLTEKESQI